MVRLIICDWNGTLFGDLFEETFCFGLCRDAALRAIRRADLPKLVRLAKAGLRGFGMYCAARRRPDRAVGHIRRIIESLNPDVFRGIRRDRLDAYTARYAAKASSGLDRRLLDPLCAVAAEASLPVGVISSGCRRAIAATLAAAEYHFDFVIANWFRMAGDVTASLEFDVADNKREHLTALLAERQVDPADVMYIGDSPHDAPCFELVGTPVVSLLATVPHKQQFRRTCGAFVPTDREDFERYLRVAAGLG